VGICHPARSDDPWLTSHLELRPPDGAVLSRYGWIFPLGTAEGEHRRFGRLSTSKRPSRPWGATKTLMSYYTDLRRDEWASPVIPRPQSSSLPPGLPMGGAVSGWPGRTGCRSRRRRPCVNPLKREAHRPTDGNGGPAGRELLWYMGDLSEACGRSLFGRTLTPAGFSSRAGLGPPAADLQPGFLPPTGPLAMRSPRLMTHRRAGEWANLGHRPKHATGWPRAVARRRPGFSRLIDRRRPVFSPDTLASSGRTSPRTKERLHGHAGDYHRIGRHPGKSEPIRLRA